MAPLAAEPLGALGLLETQGLVAGLEAADAMLKAARVRLVGLERTDPALITIQVTGETAAVRAAVEAGAAAAERIGKVLSTLVIPRPAEGLARVLEGQVPAKAAAEGDLEALTVRELRERARQLEGFPLAGRAISRATREELLRLLKGEG